MYNSCQENLEEKVCILIRKIKKKKINYLLDGTNSLTPINQNRYSISLTNGDKNLIGLFMCPTLATGPSAIISLTWSGIFVLSCLKQKKKPIKIIVTFQR